MSEKVAEQRRISVSELPSEIPDFSESFEPKDSLIKKWIVNWILSAIEKSSIKENDIMPKKSEISEYLGVSVGTVQNAIRYAEDEGYLKSKQKLGTMICNVTNPSSAMRKSTSKREKAIDAVCHVILQKGIKVGKTVPSTRKMAEVLGISTNTARLAYEFLYRKGIIDSRNTRGNDSNWILKNIPVIKDEGIKIRENITSETLVSKLTKDLKVYLGENYTVGDRIPSHEELSEILNVSVKTVHDCIKALGNEGIILSRRGRYGTVLSKNPLKPAFEPLKENSIFAKAEDAALYSYLRTETKIINLIKNNYKAGDKLPSMMELSKMFDVSTNTVRKALNNLSSRGYVAFGRGRFGGTFLIEVPEEAERQSYQWLSINPDYI